MIKTYSQIQKIFGPKSLHCIEPGNECVYNVFHVNHVNYEHTEHSLETVQRYAENHKLDPSLFYQLSDLSKYSLKFTVLKIWNQDLGTFAFFLLMIDKFT